ncbi:unnamed protein product [Haemonchus placei]|uniref:Secreted protein n=1 Tax=Haemonchus placei TaxID=6290 RepID=A0A0N4X380_HAEPC|nr:unnamed protein product [Haemonchus placei]
MRRHVILLSVIFAFNIVSAQPITVQNDGVKESSLILEDPQPLVESEDDAPPPELPHWTASEKALMIRRSGQDPTRRRRHSITRVQKLKRDLALAPWRVTHVVRRRPPPPKKTNRPAIALPVDVCPTKFDAITRGYNGRTYAFAKDRVYQMWYEDELPQKGENFVIYDAYWNLATFTGATKSIDMYVRFSGDLDVTVFLIELFQVYNARKYRILQEYPLKINEYFGCLL